MVKLTSIVALLSCVTDVRADVDTLACLPTGLSATAAEFYGEVWGGHGGSENKRVTVNGRSTYFLPRVGTEEGHCTYFYPSIPVTLTDLVNGFNAFQFAIDKGTTFWGHMLREAGAIRAAPADQHPDLAKPGLASCAMGVTATPLAGREGYRLELECPTELTPRIAGVDFRSWYHGYDENGNLRRLDWHGFTKAKEPVAMLGTAASPSRAVEWDTAMLPAQKEVAVRAAVRFKDLPGLVYLTSARRGLEIAPRTSPGERTVPPR
ncbi:MAG: hypothetical protein MUC88_25590 [Planctomycetes bacterium]|nr:hypothetical protein [Planctomycetota bacterium]